MSYGTVCGSRVSETGKRLDPHRTEGTIFPYSDKRWAMTSLPFARTGVKRTDP